MSQIGPSEHEGCPLGHPTCPYGLDRDVDAHSRRLERIEEKLDQVIADRNAIIGAIWFGRFMLGGAAFIIVYLLGNGSLPAWLKRALQ